MRCKACGYKKKMYWYSLCSKCGYYQNSCTSPKFYNILKVPGNAAKIYEAVQSKTSIEVKDCYGKVFKISS